MCGWLRRGSEQGTPVPGAFSPLGRLGQRVLQTPAGAQAQGPQSCALRIGSQAFDMPPLGKGLYLEPFPRSRVPTPDRCTTLNPRGSRALSRTLGAAGRLRQAQEGPSLQVFPGTSSPTAGPSSAEWGMPETMAPRLHRALFYFILLLG